MTDGKEAIIRVVHEGCTPESCVQWQGTTMEPWPCDTTVVLAALDALRSVLDIERKVNVQVVEGLTKCMAERDAALARAQELSARLDECGAYRVEAEDREKALAEALRPYVKSGIDIDHLGVFLAARDALAAHDARKEP